MKKSDLAFAGVLLPVDFCMLLTAGMTAYVLRFSALTAFRPVLFEIPLPIYISYCLGVSLFFIGIFACSGLYQPAAQRIRNEVQKIITACSTGIMSVIVFIFFVQELFSSRFIVLAAWFLAIVLVILGRLCVRIIRREVHKHGWGVHGVALFGGKSVCERFAFEIARQRSWGYAVVYTADSFSDSVQGELRSLRAQRKLDELIFLDTHIVQGSFQAVVDFINLNHVGLRYSADVVGGKNFDVTLLAGIPLIELRRTRLDGWGKIFKRLFDIGLSALLISILSIPMAIIAVAIRLESPGSPIYFNERVGKNKRRFYALKFRTMYREYCTGEKYDARGTAQRYELELAARLSERKGPVFKVLSDPRRTRLGRLLERFSFDELPQLCNVLVGSMSLVGPRPHMPIQVAQYEKHHHQLFMIKPGITGLAQIEGRSDLDFEDEARLDIVYIENWSPKLDFIILVKTPWVVLARRSRV